jgi:hypothetical protein
MPVSKKRKKDGKPVQRTAPAAPGEAHAHGPEAPAEAAPRPQVGRPSNPFVAQQQQRRGAQRGR